VRFERGIHQRVIRRRILAHYFVSIKAIHSICFDSGLCIKVTTKISLMEKKMFGLFVFVVSLQSEINVSNHLDRADCQVAATAIQTSVDIKDVRCVYFKPKSVEES
jgi:hypothetical protein